VKGNFNQLSSLVMKDPHGIRGVASPKVTPCKAQEDIFLTLEPEERY
jgi:hypothetical protein